MKAYYDDMSRRLYRSLRAYLEATKQSQSAVAELVGVTPSAMSLYVSGKRIPQPAIALKISRICGIPLEALLTREAA